MRSIHALRASRRGYRFWGSIGYGAGLALVLALAAVTGRDARAPLPATLSTLSILALVPALSLLLGVKLSVVLFGYERIVFYEQALLAIGSTALAFRLAGRPVACGLDLAVLGVGVFLTFGRIGCAGAGCCHGRPARRGLRYAAHQISAGAPRCYTRHQLFPVQLLDGAVSAALVAAGVVTLLTSHRCGQAAALFLGAYGPIRFVEERLRGDPVRPRWLGATEAQWTATAIAWGIVALYGRTAWTVGAAVALSLALSALIAGRRRLARTPSALRNPWHLRELEDLLRGVAANGLRATATSEGLYVSAHPLPHAEGSGAAMDLVFSRPGEALVEAPIRRLAALLWPARAGEIVIRAGGVEGVVHAIVPTAALALAAWGGGEGAR